MDDETSLFERVGGEPALRRIIERFIDRVFDDLMIGFLFRAADRARVKEKEYELAARHLGAPLRYTGRPVAEAHAPHPILVGHFARRLKILEEVLDELGAPPEVKAHWLAHDERLKGVVTRGGDCNPSQPAAALLPAPPRGRRLT